jgi:hypothetical protein
MNKIKLKKYKAGTIGPKGQKWMEDLQVRETKLHGEILALTPHELELSQKRARRYFEPAL